MPPGEQMLDGGDADILGEVFTVWSKVARLRIKSKGEWNSESVVQDEITFIEIDEVDCSRSGDVPLAPMRAK
ncbi:MAG: hypothetical protein IPL74_15090 [Bacteroidetes bacterium]|nr:hypothetical protein [Bacteroidota bacterium]